MARIPVHIKVLIDEHEMAVANYENLAGGDEASLDAAIKESREKLELAIFTYIRKRAVKMGNDVAKEKGLKL